jgi:epoxyqueuosine reductase
LNDLKDLIKQKARQLGFILAGVTSCEPPQHYSKFEAWLNAEYHGTMQYLADDRSRTRRANPKEILPECRSILVLAYPYQPHQSAGVAAYALNDDYHDVLPSKLKDIIQFIESLLGRQIPNRYYTDTGPILERELAQRAGIGWVGKNSMLINPKHGSYFLLAEIFLGIDLEPDNPFTTDHCGTCTRCIQACPTDCILPEHTIDARRCISYLTIELKDDIPQDLRPLTKDWIFGCDICQQVCPWNRFSSEIESGKSKIPLPVLTGELALTPQTFNQRFKLSPIKRAKRRGYLRNVAVAIGNTGTQNDIPALERVLQDEEPMIRTHAQWAIEQIKTRDHNA